MGKGIAKTRENILIASIHIHSWIRNLCTVDERERTRDTFKFDALPVDEPTKAARGLPANPKIKITLSNFDIEYLSGMSGVMYVMQRGFPQAIPTTSLPFGSHTLLCTLIRNYVCWMFLLVSSAHAVGCKETKYGDVSGTSWGEHPFMLRNLVDTAPSRYWKVNLRLSQQERSLKMLWSWNSMR